MTSLDRYARTPDPWGVLLVVGLALLAAAGRLVPARRGVRSAWYLLRMWASPLSGWRRRRRK